MKSSFVSLALTAALLVAAGCASDGKTAERTGTAERPMLSREEESLGSPLGERFRQLWVQPLGGQASPPGYVLHDSLYIYAVNGFLARIQRDGGGILWKSDITYPLDGPPTRDDMGRVFSMSGGELLVLDEETGGRLARRRVRSGVFESVFPADDGLAFVGSDSSIHIISDDTGFEQVLPIRLWANPLSVRSSSTSMIHIALDDATVAGHFSSTGQQAWKTSVERKVLAPIGLYEDELYVGGADFYLYRINARTGFVDWEVPVGGLVTRQPRLSKDRVFVVTHNREMMAVRPKDGTLLWDQSVPNCRTFLTADDKYVVYEQFGNRLAVADAQTGEVLGQTAQLNYASLLAGEEDGFVCMVDFVSNIRAIAPRDINPEDE